MNKPKRITWYNRFKWRLEKFELSRLEKFELSIASLIVLVLAVAYLITTIITMLYVDSTTSIKPRHLNQGLTVKIANGLIYHGQKQNN